MYIGIKIPVRDLMDNMQRKEPSHAFLMVTNDDGDHREVKVWVTSLWMREGGKAELNLSTGGGGLKTPAGMNDGCWQSVIFEADGAGNLVCTDKKTLAEQRFFID